MRPHPSISSASPVKTRPAPSAVDQIGMMIVGVPGRVERADFDRPDEDRVTLPHRHIDMVRAALLGKSALAARPLAQPRCARDMVGVDVRLDRAFQRQPQGREKLQVAFDGLEHRVDQRGLAARLARRRDRCKPTMRARTADGTALRSPLPGHGFLAHRRDHEHLRCRCRSHRRLDRGEAGARRTRGVDGRARRHAGRDRQRGAVDHRRRRPPLRRRRDVGGSVGTGRPRPRRPRRQGSGPAAHRRQPRTAGRPGHADRADAQRRALVVHRRSVVVGRSRDHDRRRASRSNRSRAASSTRAASAKRAESCRRRSTPTS